MIGPPRPRTDLEPSPTKEGSERIAKNDRADFRILAHALSGECEDAFDRITDGYAAASGKRRGGAEAAQAARRTVLFERDVIQRVDQLARAPRSRT